MEINLNEITCKMLATCERLAKDEASEARQAFKCLQMDSRASLA